MEKPFDVQDLGKRLEAQGMPAVEGLAVIAAHEVFAWLKDSIAMESQKNPLFMIGVPVLGALEPLVMSEIHKISPDAPPAA